MTAASARPKLRAVEAIVVPDPHEGRVLLLRDTQGVAAKPFAIPAAWIPVVSRFSGARTCAQIAKEAAAEMTAQVTAEDVVALAQELEDALFLEGDTFEAALAHAVNAFARLDVRPAAHAGGAYHKDQEALRTYLDEECLGHGQNAPQGRLLGLVAPHIDPWRGAACYGHAYNALTAALPKDVDTFIVLGTSHAWMREPFALCRKAFATPLGDVPADFAAIDALADAATFDAYGDQFNHKREHSLEFQAVFLKHALRDRPFRIVPILASLGGSISRGTDPERDRAADGFLRALRKLVDARQGRAVVVAGADLAHVGPRFGDPSAYTARERAILGEVDGASLDCAEAGKAAAFWEHVSRDLDSRRVCGLAPIYSLLRALPGATGRRLHYEQTVDDEDGSIVSHAAIGFYG